MNDSVVKSRLKEGFAVSKLKDMDIDVKIDEFKKSISSNCLTMLDVTTHTIPCIMGLVVNNILIATPFPQLTKDSELANEIIKNLSNKDETRGLFLCFPCNIVNYGEENITNIVDHNAVRKSNHYLLSCYIKNEPTKHFCSDAKEIFENRIIAWDTIDESVNIKSKYDKIFKHWETTSE